MKLVTREGPVRVQYTGTTRRRGGRSGNGGSELASGMLSHQRIGEACGDPPSYSKVGYRLARIVTNPVNQLEYAEL
jgi:hypothetical protein